MVKSEIYKCFNLEANLVTGQLFQKVQILVTGHHNTSAIRSTALSNCSSSGLQFYLLAKLQEASSLMSFFLVSQKSTYKGLCAGRKELKQESWPTACSHVCNGQCVGHLQSHYTQTMLKPWLMSLGFIHRQESSTAFFFRTILPIKLCQQR